MTRGSVQVKYYRSGTVERLPVARTVSAARLPFVGGMANPVDGMSEKEENAEG